MLTLPGSIVAVLVPFATLFQYRTWLKARVLLVVAILAPGQRTVAAALQVMGLSGKYRYYRCRATTPILSSQPPVKPVISL